MKKYKTSACRWNIDARIEEIEVERATTASVWINGRRNAKVTDYDMYHDTWDEAQSYLFRKCNEKIENAKRKILELEKARQKVLALMILKPEGNGD
jgi:hypothetical protein